MKNSVLITGGAGFIGSHIIDELIKDGHKVFVADNYSSKNSGYINESAVYYKVDILSQEFETVFQKHKIDICIHLAANASVNIANRDPAFDAEENILATVKLLELCKQYNVNKIIASSSAAIYGTPSFLPINEKHFAEPLSFYGLSKLTMEKYIRMSGLNYIILRFSNVYGERQSCDGEAGVIAIFDNIMKNNTNIFIDGDGNQSRDFIYVKDLSCIVVKLINKNLKNITLNISTNKAVSINDLFCQMSEIYQYNKKPIHRCKRLGDIDVSVLDNSNLISSIGCFEFTPIEVGLKNLLNSKEIASA